MPKTNEEISEFILIQSRTTEMEINEILRVIYKNPDFIILEKNIYAIVNKKMKICKDLVVRECLIEIEELFTEGYFFGLRKPIKEYDKEIFGKDGRSAQFTTFAYWPVRNAMRDACKMSGCDEGRVENIEGDVPYKEQDNQSIDKEKVNDFISQIADEVAGWNINAQEIFKMYCIDNKKRNEAAQILKITNGQISNIINRKIQPTLQRITGTENKLHDYQLLFREKLYKDMFNEKYEEYTKLKGKNNEK